MLTQRTFPQWTKNNNARLNREKKCSLERWCRTNLSASERVYGVVFVSGLLSQEPLAQALMVYLFTGHNKYNWHLQWCQPSLYRRPPPSPGGREQDVCGECNDFFPRVQRWNDFGAHLCSHASSPPLFNWACRLFFSDGVQRQMPIKEAGRQIQAGKGKFVIPQI